MENFWDYSVWAGINLIAVLLLSLLLANVLKRKIPWLNASLIPTSVLGGGVLLVLAGLYKLVCGDVMFDTAFFGGNGMANLEIITYHALALGFIASTLKAAKGKLSRKRTVEIFNTGVTTVATYLSRRWLAWASPSSSQPSSCRTFSRRPACFCPLATVRAPVRP